MNSSQLSLMRWMPTDIQQLLQNNEYSCLHLVGCIPAWAQGPFSILPLCSSGLWSDPCTSCEDPITGGGTGSGPHHHLRTLLENLFSEASDQGSATLASGLLPPLASWCWTPAGAHRHQENLQRTLMLSPALTPTGLFDPFLPPCFCSCPFPPPGMPCLLFQGFSKSRDSGLRVSSKLEDCCER